MKCDKNVWNGWESRSCHREAVDGGTMCKFHLSVERRRKERSEKWDREFKARQKHGREMQKRIAAVKKLTGLTRIDDDSDFMDDIVRVSLTELESAFGRALR